MIYTSNSTWEYFEFELWNFDIDWDIDWYEPEFISPEESDPNEVRFWMRFNCDLEFPLEVF